MVNYHEQMVPTSTEDVVFQEYDVPSVFPQQYDYQKARPAQVSRLQYIVSRNPRGVHRFLNSEGIPVTMSYASMYAGLKHYIRKRGKAGIKKLYRQVHPDRKAILDATGHSENGYCGASHYSGGALAHAAPMANAAAMSQDEVLDAIDNAEAQAQDATLAGDQMLAEKWEGILKYFKNLLKSGEELATQTTEDIEGQLEGEKELYKNLAILGVIIIVLLIITRK